MMVSFFTDGFEPYERKPLTREECLRIYGVIIEKDGELIDPRDFYTQDEENHYIMVPKAMHDDLKRWVIFDEASDIPDGMFERVMSKKGKPARRHHPVPETPRSPRGSR